MKRVLAFSIALGMLIIGLNSEPPRTYVVGEPIAVDVNSMTSAVGVIPYGHYSVKTCVPHGVRARREAIGDIMVGNRVESSGYSFQVMRNFSCRLLCDAIPMTKSGKELLADLIEQQYLANLLLDNLPVVSHPSLEGSPISLGYPLGVSAKDSGRGEPLIYNHLHFTVTVKRYSSGTIAADDRFRIVWFSVTPSSVHRNTTSACHPTKPSAGSVSSPPLTTAATTVAWTYGVDWVEDTGPTLSWGSRWEVSFWERACVGRMRRIGLITPLGIAVCIFFLLGTKIIQMRCMRVKSPEELEQAAKWKLLATDAFRAPVAVKSQVADNDSEEESKGAQTNWKLLVDYVFRPPVAVNVLAALVGYGVQLGGLMIFGLVSLHFGPQQPFARRGALLTTGLQLFCVFGFPAGYIAGGVLNVLGARPKPLQLLLMATGLPAGISTLILHYFAMTCDRRTHWATAALSFPVLTAMLFLLGGAPLFLLGSSLARKRAPPILHPDLKEWKSHPRETSLHKWYLSTWVTAPLIGITAFSTCACEFCFILTSLWVGRPYTEVGFGILTFFLFTAATAAMSMLCTTLHMDAKNQQWCWNSWASGASSGVFFFLFSLYYLRTESCINTPTGIILYIGYMAVISAMLALYGGAVGFLSSWRLVCKMYSSLAEKDFEVEVADEPIEPLSRVGIEEHSFDIPSKSEFV